MNNAYDFIKGKSVRLGQKAAKRMGVDPKNARPGELLLFAKLDPSKSDYRLSLNHDDASKVLNFAKGLKDRNAFVAAGMAMGFLSAPIINGVEYPEAADIVYHADPFIFDTPATNNLSEAQAVGSIYTSGTHTLKTNQGIRIDNEPNIGFRTVHQTQASATTQNQFYGACIKFFGALVRFGGGDENEVIINLKCQDKTDIAGAAGARQNYLAVRLVGGIIHGATTKTYVG